MVGEFPELQGVMGGYYARLAGQPDAVADAIRDHYKPQGPADTVPTAPVTVAVALAEKLDTLVGFFAIDEKPTGSKDPFALRRAALGVIRLVLDNGVRGGYWHSLRVVRVTPVINDFISGMRSLEVAEKGRLEQAARTLADFDILPMQVRNEVDGLISSGSKFDETVASHPAYTKALDDLSDAVVKELEIHKSVERDLLAFFADRLTVLLRDRGQRHDLVAAVFALGDDDLVRIVRRVEALAAFLATDDGANLLAGYKRASNILRAEEKKGPVPTGMVRTGLLNQPEPETALAFAVGAAQTAVDIALDAEDFAAAMTALAALRAPVDAFFTDVLVNSDVAEERDNRLKLLGQVREVMGKVADFGQIAG